MLLVANEGTIYQGCWSGKILDMTLYWMQNVIEKGDSCHIPCRTLASEDECLVHWPAAKFPVNHCGLFRYEWDIWQHGTARWKAGVLIYELSSQYNWCFWKVSLMVVFRKSNLGTGLWYKSLSQLISTQILKTLHFYLLGNIFILYASVWIFP